MIDAIRGAIPRAKYLKDDRTIKYPKIGRPFRVPLGRQELSTILSARAGKRRGAVPPELRVERETGMHIPHNAIHRTMKDMNLAGKTVPVRRKSIVRGHNRCSQRYAFRPGVKPKNPPFVVLQSTYAVPWQRTVQDRRNCVSD